MYNARVSVLKLRLLSTSLINYFFPRRCTGLYQKAVIFSCSENASYLNKWIEGINLLSLSKINFKTFSLSFSQNYNNLFNAFFRSLTHSKKHAIKLFWVVSCHYKNKTKFSSFSGFSRSFNKPTPSIRSKFPPSFKEGYFSAFVKRV